MNVDVGGVLKGLAAQQLRADKALEAYGKTCGEKLEAHAKQTTPWVNRTGNARNSIQGGTFKHGAIQSVYVSGNVDYFPYLELANAKQNAVLVPTVEALQEELIQGLSGLLEK